MPISTAVDSSAIARVVGINTSFVDLQTGSRFLPQRIAVVGQGVTGGVYSTVKRQVTSQSEAGSVYGFGSPIHLAVAQLLPTNGDGVGSVPVTVYPLEDAVSSVAANGDITPAGSESSAKSYQIMISGISSVQFVVSPGDSVADIVSNITNAINSTLSMPVTAVNDTTKVSITSKWKGASANDLHITVIGSGLTTFAITQPTGGLVNPVIDDALAQVGGVWETMVLNCLNISDETTLDKFQVFGEGRWNALVNKPCVVISGSNETNVNTAVAIAETRKDDYTNIQLVGVGSNNLPFVVAARQLSRIAVRANNNPPYDYAGLVATGINPGTDGQQWDYSEQDFAVKAGISTINVNNGVIEIADTVTFYHPVGEEPPAYRYLVDIVKLQNIIYNLSLIFASDGWNGVPLIPDNQPSTNPMAKRPKDAKGDIFGLLDELGLNAIISDVPFAKANTLVGINSTNPKRLDISVTLKLSGNANIRSLDLNFGFYFGASA